jgi:hypothetical protein
MQRYPLYGITAALLIAGLGFAGCGGGGGGGGGFAAAAVTSSTPSATTTAGIGSAVTPRGPAQRTAPANLLTGPVVALDTSGAGTFFDQPFPSNARVHPNGAPDLHGIPNPRSKQFIDKIVALGESDTRGFSPTGALYFRFDAPILAPVDDPVQTLDPSSSVILVDIDPASSHRLERQPFHVQVSTTPTSFRPVNLLQLLPVPGRGLRPNTTYAAIVLRRVGGPTTQWLGQPPAMTALLAGRDPGGAMGPALQRAFMPLRNALDDLWIHPDDIAAATVFTTGDPAASLIKQVGWALQQPALSPTRLEQRDVYPDFVALRGWFSPPQYQSGSAPFLSGGRQVVDANGLPVTQWSDRAEFQVSIPKGRMPAAGFPLYFYVHGTGGAAAQVIDAGRRTVATVPAPLGTGLASIVAPKGWAASCCSGHMSPGRIGTLSADGYMAYNFFNPVAMRDNFKQMILEQVHFRNLLLHLRIDPALCPGVDASASPDGKIGFDPQLLVVGGQSLGSYLSGMLAATVPGWKGAILSGAGGSWVEFGFGPKDPVDLQLALEVLAVPPGEKLDQFHPMVMAFDLAVGEADNTHYVQHIVRELLPGHVPPHVLVIEGNVDLQVPTNLQRALILGVGADLVGPDVGLRPIDRVEPALPWGGLHQLPYGATANFTCPGGEVRSVLAVRYAEDGIREGHYVWIQRDEPKRHIRDFLDAMVAGTAPIVR